MRSIKRWFVMMAVGGTLLAGPSSCVVAPVEPAYVASPPAVVIRHYRHYYPRRYYRPYRPHWHYHYHPHRYYRPYHPHWHYHPYRYYRPYRHYYGYPYGRRW
jgi:hypothetical protein